MICGMYYKHVVIEILGCCNNGMNYKRVTTIIYNCNNHGLYYKHVTVVNYTSSCLTRTVNYAPRMTTQFHSGGIIYNPNTLRVQTTGEHVILSKCRIVKIPFCQRANLSKIPFCQCVILSKCQFVNDPFCQCAILANLPFRQYATSSSSIC